MEKENKKRSKKEILKKWFLPGAAILIFIFALVFSSLEGKNREVNDEYNLEEEMAEMVSSFYDKNIKGKVIGVDKQIVTLKDLQSQAYDINHFIIAECDLESYSYVVLDDPQETDVKKIKYTIEHHLDCK